MGYPTDRDFEDSWRDREPPNHKKDRRQKAIAERARVSEEIWDFHLDGCQTCKMSRKDGIYTFCSIGLEFFKEFILDHNRLLEEIR